MILLAALSLFVEDPSVGYDRPANVELTPMVGYSLGDDFEDDNSGADVELDDDAHFGLILNFWAKDNTEWEIFYSHQESQLDTSGTFINQPTLDVDVDYLHAGGTFLFDGEVARPYIVATLGASHFDPDDSNFDSETFFSASFGGGLKLFPKKRFGIRLESRLFGSWLDTESDIFCQTGPQANVCAVSIEGNVLWQWQTTAGFIFRF